MKARFFKATQLQGLMNKIEDNLDVYRTGDFEFLLHDQSYFFESSLEILPEKLALISCAADDHREVDNCIHMFEAMGLISNYLARDDRLWAYLTHTYLLNYSRSRWPIPQDNVEAIKHIKAHFFCMGARGIERDNAASRLWWLASLCNRAQGLSFRDALTTLLFKTDVRANIVERPTTSQNVRVFTGLLKMFNDSFKTEEKALFERQKYRALMKEINLIGGVLLLAALPEPKISQLLKDCASRA